MPPSHFSLEKKIKLEKIEKKEEENPQSNFPLEYHNFPRFNLIQLNPVF